MPATYDTYHLRNRSERRLSRFAPGATAATLVTLDQPSTKCLPIATHKRFIAGVLRTAGTTGLTSFKIIAATAADGTGNTAVVAHATPGTADAIGDTVWLECDVEQIREVLPAATHVGVEIAQVTGADTCTVVFERADPTFVGNQPTQDYIA